MSMVIETIVIWNKAIEYDILYLVSLKIRILSVEERKYRLRLIYNKTPRYLI